MSQSLKPSYDRSLACQPGETGESYQARLAARRAEKQFPEFDPAYVTALVAQQEAEGKAKGRGPQPTV